MNLVDVETRGDVTRVSLLRREYSSLDDTALKQLTDELRSIGTAGKHVVVAFGRTRYFGAGLANLLFAARQLTHRHGRRIAACNLTPECRDLANRLRLNDLVLMPDDDSEMAVSSLNDGCSIDDVVEE